MTDDEFLAHFENAALSRSEWNHAVHLRMAYLYLKNGDSWEAVLPQVRERIRYFNAAHRNYSGYHETITAAFLRIVHHRLRNAVEATASFDAFQSQNGDLFEGLAFLLRFYDKATLVAPDARTGFVPPDRELLP